MKKIIFVLLLVLGLAACHQVQTLMPTATPTLPATQVRSTQPTQTLRPSASLTRTQTYTITPDQTKIFQATSSQTIQSIYTATNPEKNNQEEQYPFICKKGYPPDFSPDTDWMAKYCLEEEKFVVINKDGTKKWVITNKQILEPYRTSLGQYFEYLSISSIHIFHWSSDSRYIYFFAYVEPQPDIGTPYLNFAMDYSTESLYRLDTSNGIWEKFIEANSFSFAPTDRRMAFINADRYDCEGRNCQLRISILDLKTGDISQHVIQNTLAAGYIVWMNDGTKFFFSAMQKSTSQPWTFEYTIYSVDTITNSLVVLHHYEPTYNLIYPIKWDQNNILTIKIEKQSPEGGIEYQYLDLATQSFVQFTPTP